MIKIVCAIYDVKTKIYSQPYLFFNKEHALRDMGSLANDVDTQCGAHPEDYVLYQLGTYDDNTGIILAPEGDHEVICKLVHLVTKEQQEFEARRKMYSRGEISYLDANTKEEANEKQEDKK